MPLMEKQIVIMNRPFPLVTVLIAVAVAGFLIWVLFRGCGGNTDKVKRDKAKVDSIIQLQKETQRVADIKIKYWQDSTAKVTKERTILKQQVNLLEHQLNISKYEATKLAYKVGKAKIIRDTVGYVNSCDSLVKEVEQLTAWIDGYQERMEMLGENYEQELEGKDSIAAIQVEVIRMQRDALRDVAAKYDGLYTDYNKLNKIRKRERFLNRVLAVLVLAAGAKIALDK